MIIDRYETLGDRTGSDGRHSVENTAQMGCDLRSNHHVEFGTDNKFWRPTMAQQRLCHREVAESCRADHADNRQLDGNVRKRNGVAEAWPWPHGHL